MEYDGETLVIDRTPSELDEMMLDACDTRFNRVRLMGIPNDHPRRRWYLDAEADDQRVGNAFAPLKETNEP